MASVAIYVCNKTYMFWPDMYSCLQVTLERKLMMSTSADIKQWEIL